MKKVNVSSEVAKLNASYENILANIRKLEASKNDIILSNKSEPINIVAQKIDEIVNKLKDDAAKVKSLRSNIISKAKEINDEIEEAERRERLRKIQEAKRKNLNKKKELF